MKNIIVNIDQLNEDMFVMMRENSELVDEFLEQDGYNPAEIEIRAISKVKALLFKHKVALKKIQIESLYLRALTAFVSAQESSKEVILQLLYQRAPKLQFNNLEKMDENDLKAILDESDLLDLMEKIAKEDLK